MKTRSYMYLKLLSLLALGLVLCPLSALAQGGGFRSTSQSARDGLSDGSSFYMSRRQMQVVDDSPIIKYSGGGQAPPGAAGGFGGAAAPLPRAGFQSYSSSINQTYQAPCPRLTTACRPNRSFQPKAVDQAGQARSRPKPAAWVRAKAKVNQMQRLKPPHRPCLRELRAPMPTTVTKATTQRLQCLTAAAPPEPERLPEPVLPPRPMSKAVCCTGQDAAGACNRAIVTEIWLQFY